MVDGRSTLGRFLAAEKDHAEKDHAEKDHAEKDHAEKDHAEKVIAGGSVLNIWLGFCNWPPGHSKNSDRRQEPPLESTCGMYPSCEPRRSFGQSDKGQSDKGHSSHQRFDPLRSFSRRGLILLLAFCDFYGMIDRNVPDNLCLSIWPTDLDFVY